MVYLYTAITLLALAGSVWLFYRWWKKPSVLASPAPGTEQDAVPSYPVLYLLGLLCLAGVWVILGYWLKGNPFETHYLGELDVGYLVWTLGALHFAAGFRIVRIDMLGGVFLFGVPTVEVTGKPIIVPPGIFSLGTVSRKVLEMEFPENPEKIYRGDAPEVPLGLKPPIRIPFANPPQNDASGINPNDPLHRRSTNEVTFFVRMQVTSVFDFLVHIGDETAARVQLEDMGVSVLNDELTQLTPAQALQKIGEKSQRLEDDIRKRTRWWGVKIHNARIKLIEFSHGLNSSIQGIPKAAADAQATVLTAEGEKTKRTREGEGDAAARKADLVERTAGLKKMAEDLGVETSVVIAAETAQAIGKSSSDKIIVGTQGFADLLGIGTAIAGAIKPPPTGPAPAVPPTTPEGTPR